MALTEVTKALMAGNAHQAESIDSVRTDNGDSTPLSIVESLCAEESGADHPGCPKCRSRVFSPEFSTP
ncbi:hypothetical protein [Nocardia sp. CA-119907]|uniref:hypothetical protein n=1 Tax=Nocardia sp. CA-119907 TaxID=3239973 RepID=UPI003D96E018